jgi:hypothetical protein
VLDNQSAGCLCLFGNWQAFDAALKDLGETRGRERGQDAQACCKYRIVEFPWPSNLESDKHFGALHDKFGCGDADLQLMGDFSMNNNHIAHRRSQYSVEHYV